jgi:hypothetical protein
MMMKRIPVSILLALTLFVILPMISAQQRKTPARGQDWSYVATTEGHSFYYWLKSLRKLPNGYRRMWIKEVVGDRNEHGPYTETLDEYDCVNERSRTISIVAYDENDVSQGYQPNDRAKWEYVIPETAGEALLRIACKRR